MTFTDAQLTAFLNGTADKDLSQRIETALATDTALEDRMMALDPLAEVVHDAIKPLGNDRATPSPMPSPAAKSRFIPAAVAAVLGALVVYALAFTGPRTSDIWMEQVAIYQALYSADTIALIEPTPEALETQFARIEEVMGTAVPQNRVAQATDLTLLRAQILAFEGQPLAQIVFADAQGRPIALCLMETGRPTDDILTAQRAGLQTASFSVEGITYLLLGDTDPEEAGSLAAAFQTALTSS